MKKIGPGSTPPAGAPQGRRPVRMNAPKSTGRTSQLNESEPELPPPGWASYTGTTGQLHLAVLEGLDSLGERAYGSGAGSPLDVRAQAMRGNPSVSSRTRD